MRAHRYALSLVHDDLTDLHALHQSKEGRRADY